MSSIHGVLAGLDGDGLLGVAEAALGRLGAQVLDAAVDDAALVASVQRLARLETMAHAEKLRRIAEVDARRAWLGTGAGSTVDLLAAQLGLTRGEAAAQAATAVGLARLPQTAAKLAAGELGAGQAQVAVRALGELDAAAGRQPDESSRGDGADAGEAAGEADAGSGGGGEAQAERTAALDALVAGHGSGLDRRRLRDTVDRWAHRNGVDQLAQRERRAFARRRLWLGPDPADGSTIVDGRLHPVGGAAVTAAIDALARPDGPDDARSLAQRRADALVALAQQALTGRGRPTSPADDGHAGGPPSGPPADAGDRPSRDGDAAMPARPAAQVLLITSPAALHDHPGADASQLDGVGPVSAATAAQICCDAELTQVVLDRNGNLLDVGRARRTPTAAQRKAVIARDRACVGCAAPVARCQIHHIRWWRDHGPTNLDNLALVCWACHHHIHHHGWQVTRAPDGRYTAGPPRAHPPDQRLRHTA